MKALKIIGIVLAVFLGIVILLGLIAPKDYDMKRSSLIRRAILPP